MALYTTFIGLDEGQERSVALYVRVVTAPNPSPAGARKGKRRQWMSDARNGSNDYRLNSVRRGSTVGYSDSVL